MFSKSLKCAVHKTNLNYGCCQSIVKSFSDYSKVSDKVLQKSIGTGMDRLVALGNLFLPNERARFKTIHDSFPNVPFKIAYTLKLFTDYQNLLLEKYKLDESELIKGAEECGPIFIKALCDSEFTESIIDKKTAFSSELIQSITSPIFYKICSDAMEEIHNKKLNLSFVDIKVNKVNISNIRTDIYERNVRNSRNDSIFRVQHHIRNTIINFLTYPNKMPKEKVTMSFEIKFNKDDTSQGGGVGSEQQQVEDKAKEFVSKIHDKMKEDKENQKKYLNNDVGQLHFKEDSVIATIDLWLQSSVTYQVPRSEELTSTSSDDTTDDTDDTHETKSRKTLTRLTFSGCISPHSETEWKLISFGDLTEQFDMGDYKSYKWITSDLNQKGKMIQVHNVSQAFNPVARSPCNIISIFGRARQGKSFLMNCLAGERDIFRISNEKESCTQGIDISNKWLTLSDFSRIDGGKPTVPRTADLRIGFVDAEGQGDKDVSYDANLICPILLASKCVIFNWKGDLQKDHILSTLGIMTRAARNVSSDSSVDSHSNLKPSASTAAIHGSEPHVVRKKFGHLHIIFRDWQSVNSDENSTFNALFKLEETVEGSTRDQIRADVLESFESIKVWLFDAPSDYVADLKKKLTFDKTSVAFRGQVRALRNWMSGQLREPTILYGNQPLLGKSFNPMISLIADSLNRGEVVMPSSAYVSMMRMEVDKIKLDYENDMRNTMEQVLGEIDGIAVNGLASVAATTEVCLYPTEKKALALLGEAFGKLSVKYDGEMQKSIGTISSAIADQILADYPAQIQRINDILGEQFVARFRNNFSKWLLAARRKAQNVISEACSDFMSHTDPLPEAEVDAFLQHTLQSGVVIIGGTAVYGADCEEAKDAHEVLTKHMVMLASDVRHHNEYLVAESRNQVVKYLSEAINQMEKTLTETVNKLNKTQPTGYLLKALEDVLNARYFELRDQLATKCGQNFHTNALLTEFKKSCGDMRDKMVTEYNQSRQNAYNNGLKVAGDMANIRFSEARKVEFDRDVHNEQWLLNHFNMIIVQVKRHVNNTVAGWGGSVTARDNDNNIVAGDADYISFENDLSEVLEAMAMNASISIMAEWKDKIETQDAMAAELEELRLQEEAENRRKEQQRLEQLRLQQLEADRLHAEELARQQAEWEEQQENSTIPMDEDDDEEEDYDEEDEDDVDNTARTTPRRPAVDGKEQRQRAQKWAEESLGMKVKKTPVKRGTAASRATAAKLLKPVKTVEQQRADAAAFAKQQYGEQILNKTPVTSAEKVPRKSGSGGSKRGLYDDDEEDDNVGADDYSESDRRATLVLPGGSAPQTSTGGGGLFSNVRNWFGAPVQQQQEEAATFITANEAKTPTSAAKKVAVSTVPVTTTVPPTTSVSSSGAKPLTALQQAKAEAKRLEAERVASMVTAKKGGKKG